MITRPIYAEYNSETDVITYREMNDAEYAEFLTLEQEAANRDAGAQAKVDAKASAHAKLAKLGLTAEEIAAL